MTNEWLRSREDCQHDILKSVCAGSGSPNHRPAQIESYRVESQHCRRSRTFQISGPEGSAFQNERERLRRSSRRTVLRRLFQGETPKSIAAKYGVGRVCGRVECQGHLPFALAPPVVVVFDPIRFALCSFSATRGTTTTERTRALELRRMASSTSLTVARAPERAAVLPPGLPRNVVKSLSTCAH